MPSYSGIWSLSQQFQGRGQGLWPTAPGAPTIGTATGANASASVAFTAPACAGVPATITGYTATSTPGCITGTGSSSPITVSGLTNCTAYTFKVKATNAAGTGPCSAASNSVTPTAAGSQSFTTAGTFTWVAPAGVTKVSVVTVGGGGRGGLSCGTFPASGLGGGGGGALAYINNTTVVPGNSYTVVVGAAQGFSYFNTVGTVQAGGGNLATSYVGAPGGTVGAGTGFAGGVGGRSCCCLGGAGGGGAGGYAGIGGTGGAGNIFSAPTTPSGGGGGGGAGGFGQTVTGAGGGGVGILGQGSSGAAGFSSGGGGGGSGGSAGSNAGVSGGAGGLYGGGGGGNWASGSGAGAGAVGAVRIIWPGCSRSFPSTNTGSP